MTEQPAQPWGRVDADGTVYVRTSTGERVVGQWPGGDPAETMAFFARRFENLSVEVDLLERRVRDRRVPPPAAVTAVAKLRAQVSDAQAVGDLDALLARLAALDALVAAQREERKAERRARIEQARVRKQQIVTQAQQLAAGKDWRSGATRLQELLEEWRSLDRLDKETDTALWRQFSAARTTYAELRRRHFTELAERRRSAQQAKLGLVDEAEALAASTDWRTTAGRFRELMTRWKATGAASRPVEDRLWARFRAAQDRFFSARDEANAAQETQLAANAARKDALLAEAEALLPSSDPRAARAAFRDIARRWDQAGKVPRAAMKAYENRFRRVEEAVLGAEDERWRRGNPEGLARAQATVAQLEASIAELEATLSAARASDDERRIGDAEEALATRRSWLEQAVRARDEFSAS